jgi:uncharacterized protein
MKDNGSAMEIDLGRVEDRSTFSFDRTFPLPTPEGGTATCTAAVTVDATRLFSRYDVVGRIKGEILAECHRCLEPFAMPVDVDFSLILNRGERTPLPDGVEEDDFVTIPIVGEARADIFPRVREALILEIPIRLLCREDCKGVCSKCGANLNTGDCTCGPGPGDPRWGALRKFLNGKSKT